jgi:hypothetical protein
MKYLELRSFDETPKKGSKIVCFGNYDCGYYFIDGSKGAWCYYEGLEESTERACDLDFLQEYGRYEKWAYLENSFDIPYDYEEIVKAEMEIERNAWNKMVDEHEKTLN